MIPNPIVKVLSTLSSNAVRYLLMGGQACVFYGAAEFSRDCDIVLLADTENLARLRNALDELQATCIAVPPLERKFLERGHAVHFRCNHIEARGIRLDVMTRLRGVDEFAQLWDRRTTLVDAQNIQYDVLGLHDLIRAKKTQRDKDWPMIRRLVESHYATHGGRPSETQVTFWLRESRTPDMLLQLVASYARLAREVAHDRQAVSAACAGDRAAVEQALLLEEDMEKKADRDYWIPLKLELESLRRSQRNSPNDTTG